MVANGWILSLHLLSLIFWIGNLLVLSRLLAFHAGQPPEVQDRLLPLARRIWRVASPVGAMVLVTGLLMIHGVGTPRSVGESLRWYFVPRVEGGEPSFWYVTFHVKMVAFIVLMFTDFWLGRQVYRLARSRPSAPWWPLGVLLALTGILFTVAGTWIALSSAGISFGLQVGWGAGVVAAALGLLAGRRLGGGASRQRFMAAHGIIAALVLLIVVLVLARPLPLAALLN
jgi:uncharacterized membrane protein